MQIHELNSATPAATDSIAMDNGTDTYRATPTTVVSNSAPTFTTGDASSPTAWESVSTISSGLGFGTLLNRITTMIKNVRYLYSRQGTTAMGTTATTITGAIAEHETDITATNALMGDTSISGIGGGTVTGAISTINSSLSKTTGSGSASNSFGTITYQWAMRGNIATVYVEYVPSGNISSSSGSLLLSTIPAPSVKVYSATKDLGSHPTVCAPADLATNRNCYFYGARTAEHTYTASFTYVVG